jgi:hypothetical protein
VHIRSGGRLRMIEDADLDQLFDFERDPALNHQDRRSLEGLDPDAAFTS